MVRGKVMKNKWTPSIMIWNLKVRDEDANILQNLYFLSFKRAMKFWKKHAVEIYEKNYKVGLGGEQLWLW